MQRIKTNKIQDFEIKHQTIVRENAPESMVLLKNEGILPLKECHHIALYGNGARNTIKGGTGSGDVNVRHFVNIEEGLKNAGIRLTSNDWLDQYSQLKADYVQKYKENIIATAKKKGEDVFMALMGKAPLEPDYDLPLSKTAADAAIYVLARDSGEGADRQIKRGDLKLTKTEVHDILILANMYHNFVLVLNVGGLVDLTEVKDHVPAILLMSQLGSASGDAVADVLLGKAYPSGKLAMTWAAIEDYPSTKNFGDINDTRYEEGIYVGYRYFDSLGLKPTYEFGYGLSYTDFTINTKRVLVNSKEIQIQAEVKNIGKLPGKEVVQLYYSAPSNVLKQPYQELAAYTKTNELVPGERTIVTLKFSPCEMASFDTENGVDLLSHGTYLLRLGNSSRHTQVIAKINLKQNVILAYHRHITDAANIKDMVIKNHSVTYPEEMAEIEHAPIYQLNSRDFQKQEFNYAPEKIVEKSVSMQVNWLDVVKGKATIDNFVVSLSDKQLVTLLTGNYEKGEGFAVVGNAGSTVAGAAGETTHKLEQLGVSPLVMADGPAGIRLSTIYKLDKEGKAHAVTSQFAGIEGTKADKDNVETKYYQYCTAIPIGTAIAQSWNRNVIQLYGNLVGDEMERFGVDIWLAPALNIQRSPLDGRNFEYYSEDPLISGLSAAYITKGVRQHPGCTTTIKHFVANNQETNRFFSNSVVSERALRHIYLRGFEIAVKVGKPLALMTSYNLVDGIHTCNRYDLLTQTARNEWGFKGFIMTDWLVTANFIPNEGKYSSASAAKNVIAGNDVTMPGLKSDTDEILTEVKAGKIKRQQLEIAARHVLRVILQLKKEK